MEGAPKEGTPLREQEKNNCYQVNGRILKGQGALECPGGPFGAQAEASKRVQAQALKEFMGDSNGPGVP